MDGRLELALILANETGHLLGALRHLRWSDVDLDAGRIRWRAEHDKIGFEHATPISPVLSDALGAPIRRAKFRAGGGFLQALPMHAQRSGRRGNVATVALQGRGRRILQPSPRFC